MDIQRKNKIFNRFIYQKNKQGCLGMLEVLFIFSIPK